KILALRFIDDLFVINCPTFLQLAEQIYGHDDVLEITHTGDYCNFLDLAIQVNPIEHLETAVYNKTDSFPFTVTRYGHPDSNVSIKVHSATISGQLLWYARISSHCKGFTAKARELFSTFENRGFGRKFLIDQFFIFVPFSTAPHRRQAPMRGVAGYFKRGVPPLHEFELVY
ncbi:MAG: hypothetical protein GY861_10555, partial [bacterium]|nr:hypothetical protein [bacterium]